MQLLSRVLNVNYTECESTVYDISLDKYDIKDKRKILRNMVNPKLGKYILDRAMEKEILIQNGLFD